MFRSISRRLLILTVLFVMLAEILIFVPSIALFRQNFLLLRLEKSQIAALSLEAQEMIPPELEAELLRNAGVYNLVLRRDDTRQLILSSAIPGMIHATYDLRMETALSLIGDAMIRLWDSEDRVIRVVGQPLRMGGLEIEVTMSTSELRMAMFDYGRNIFLLSLVISLVTAVLIYASLRMTVVNPMRRVVRAMMSYAKAPEDHTRVIVPQSSVTELRDAEDALAALQTELTQALKQRERLAQLGGAVAKISHDLRNILTVAQLFADRMESSDDPAVKRAAPKLVASISRAVNLCEGTLAFGRAEEPAPRMTQFSLAALVADVLESEDLTHQQNAPAPKIVFEADIAPGTNIRGDQEQLHRVLGNLVRNARQAIEAAGSEGRIQIGVTEDDAHWQIRVADTGPGLPPKAREHLFTPFQGGIRKGGTGLGLAIAAELTRGHGGRLRLERSDSDGTVFIIELPKHHIDRDFTLAKQSPRR